MCGILNTILKWAVVFIQKLKLKEKVTSCTLSRVQAMGSHAIDIPLSSRRRIMCFVSKTAMWVELLCQCRARPPLVVLMFSELLPNSQKGSESACTGRQVCLYVRIFYKNGLILAEVVEHIFTYTVCKHHLDVFMLDFVLPCISFQSSEMREVTRETGDSVQGLPEIITINW